MSLAWYDVLSCLYLSPDHAMRMCDLAEQVLMSRSWLTRRVDQLVKADLVERCSAENDGRGVQARLTRTGKRTFIKLQRSHGTAIDRHFSAYLSAEDAEVLIRVMGKIAESADRALKADTPIAPKTNALKS